MLDYSMSTKGITCNLKSQNTIEKLSRVQTVVDSFYSDNIFGNDAANFISSKGNDFVRGNGGNDVYKITKNCRNTVIDNYDSHLDEDVIFIDQDFGDITLDIEPINKSLEIHIKNFGRAITLLNWFKNKESRHASVRTMDKILALLPEDLDTFTSDSLPTAIQISLEDENCDDDTKSYDLSQEKFQNVARFTAKSNHCSYKITGNSLNNYLDPGPGNSFNYQYLEGGNGSDTYVIGPNYGQFNEINNYAKDMLVDFVMLSVVYHNVEVDIVAGTKDIIVRSKAKNNQVDIRIKNFLLGKEYQHIVFQSADKITFRLLPHYPHKRSMIVDYSKSKFNQILNTSHHFPSARVIYGSDEKANRIYGSMFSKRLVGGSKSDVISGGKNGEQIEGFDGADTLKGNGGNDIIFGGYGDDNISGGNGNDVISGGFGADDIDGGRGMDAIILVGDIVKKKGVNVSLKSGIGLNGDAQGDRYHSIEIVHGSKFNDILEGNDDNNMLSGNTGQDKLTTYKGYDVLIGGLDSDTYNLTKAEGWKIINNFASDEANDVVLLGDDILVEPCQYAYKDDLFINIKRNNNRYLNLILNEWNKNKTFQHMTLKYTRARSQVQTLSFPERPVDNWVSFFNTNAYVKIVDYSSNSITVNVDDIIKHIPQDDYELFLNYIGENKPYKKVPLHGKWNNGSPNIKLESNILGGAMASVMLSLHKCGQVLAMTVPVTQRSLPNPPTDLKLTHRSSVSLTVSWNAPPNATDPNYQYYRYRCIAYEMNARVKTEVNLLSKRMATSCLFDRLRRNTDYKIHVFSVIAGEQSKNAAILNAKTDHICQKLPEPANTYIIDEMIKNKKEYATVECHEGYELTTTNQKNFRKKTVRNLTLCTFIPYLT